LVGSSIEIGRTVQTSARRPRFERLARQLRRVPERTRSRATDARGHEDQCRLRNGAAYQGAPGPVSPSSAPKSSHGRAPRRHQHQRDGGALTPAKMQRRSRSTERRIGIAVDRRRRPSHHLDEKRRRGRRRHTSWRCERRRHDRARRAKGRRQLVTDGDVNSASRARTRARRAQSSA